MARRDRRRAEEGARSRSQDQGHGTLARVVDDGLHGKRLTADGAGGLGQFINRGLALADSRLILMGAIPAALLALIVDFAIAALQSLAANFDNW